MARLTDAEIAERLRGLEGWAREGEAIVNTFRRKDFRDALAFVNRIAEAAEAANHHPDIRIHGYRRVTLTYTTHSEGGITDKDFQGAREAERLATA